MLMAAQVDERVVQLWSRHGVGSPSKERQILATFNANISSASAKIFALKMAFASSSVKAVEARVTVPEYTEWLLHSTLRGLLRTYTARKRALLSPRTKVWPRILRRRLALMRDRDRARR